MLISAFGVFSVLAMTCPAGAALDLGPETIVQAGGVDLTVTGYSVPSFADWDNDGLCDLVVGEGGDGITEAKVRVYRNLGTVQEPAFDTYFFVQAGGGDLILTASGCLGLFPRTTYWDADARKDLLVGTAQGNVRIYLNIGSDESPIFDAGTTLQVGSPGTKVDISVGGRACPTHVDWDHDGIRDLVVGGLDGRIYLFINEGSENSPDFLATAHAQTSGGDLYVSGTRSSPVIADFDDDELADILTGNTNGQLLLYSNTGSETTPIFGSYVAIEADGVPIDLPSYARSRPFMCDWSNDGYPDVVIGAYGGRLHLFEGEENLNPVPIPESLLTLSEPWPNPFNPRVNLTLELAEAMPIRVVIFDIRGRQVQVCTDKNLATGSTRITWAGNDAQGRKMPAGVYFAQVQAPRATLTKRLVLVR
ncbi:MAG: FG-GAP-like repeat-containing protein [bacterium]